MISPTAGSRRVLSCPVGVKSQSGRKAVMYGIFVCWGATRPRAQHLRLRRKIETHRPQPASLTPRSSADAAWLPRLLGRCARNDLGTDPQPGTDDASCQALTLASFGEGPQRVRFHALMHRNRTQGSKPHRWAVSPHRPRAEFDNLTPFSGWSSAKLSFRPI